MRTLVLIPAYNEEKNLERVIENLKKKAPQFDYIIINDGSTDHTEKLCRKKQYHYISLPVNLGLTGAMQTGMKRTMIWQFSLMRMDSICRNTYKKWWTAWRKQTAML
mgnify:CR=1 FL=1